MKIVIVGNYGAKNLGDEMILEGLLETLRKNALNSLPTADAEITVLSANPAETRARYSNYNINSELKSPAGVRSFLKYIFTFKNPTKKALKDCDYFILGGGGLFGSLSFQANLIWTIQAKMAYRLKKPVIMLGQSIGAIKWAIIRWLVKGIFQKAAFISVRDRDSREVLRQMGVTKQITVAPDLAFAVPLAQKKTHHTVSDKKTAIIALRQMKNLPKNFHKNIAEFLNWLVAKQKYRLKFINFQEGMEGDGQLHEQIIKLMDDHSKAEYIEQKNLKGTGDLLKIFQKADFVLGMRLHSIISAIKADTPFIAINYASKVENLLKDRKLSAFCLNLNELTCEELKQQYLGSLSHFKSSSTPAK